MRRASLFVGMLIVVSLVFTVSCVTREVPVTETYYETEYKTESYSEIEDVGHTRWGVDDISTKSQWHSARLTLSTCGNRLWYFGYEIPHHDISQVEITFSQYPLPLPIGGFIVYDLSNVGQIPTPPTGLPDVTPFSDELRVWLGMCNTKLSSAPRIVTAKTPEPLELDIAGVTDLAIVVCGPNFSYDWTPIQAVKLTWGDNVVEKKPVAKEKQISYQVEKQRTVTKTMKVPFWQ